MCIRDRARLRDLQNEYALKQNSLNPEETEELLQKLFAASEQYKEAKIASAHYRETYRWGDANDTMYNELYSDLAGVLGSNNNPKAIYSAFVNKSIEENSPDYALQKSGRDFSYPKNLIDLWSEDSSKSLHTHLAPVRYHIYKNIIQKHDFTDPYSKYYLSLIHI